MASNVILFLFRFFHGTYIDRTLTVWNSTQALWVLATYYSIIALYSPENEGVPSFPVVDSFSYATTTIATTTTTTNDNNVYLEFLLCDTPG